MDTSGVRRAEKEEREVGEVLKAKKTPKTQEEQLIIPFMRNEVISEQRLWGARHTAGTKRQKIKHKKKYDFEKC